MNAAFDPARVHQVRVTNNTDKVWSDRYDGVPVTVEPGESETIPLDMARHFFGYSPGAKPEVMLMHIMRRRGALPQEGDWPHIYANPEICRRLAGEFFSTFKVEPVSYRLVEERVAPKPDQPVAAVQHDEEADVRVHEPTSIKDLARTGIEQPDDEPHPQPGRGHPRRDSHGRRRE